MPFVLMSALQFVGIIHGTELCIMNGNPSEPEYLAGEFGFEHFAKIVADFRFPVRALVIPNPPVREDIHGLLSTFDRDASQFTAADP
jgi:hypothetical protein